MPKKRHQKFPKPSTAYPPTAATTASSSSSSHESVNTLLARLRAHGHPDPDSPRPRHPSSMTATRSVPPQLQQLLSDGRPPSPPPPRRGVRNPRVAGPPPPASWLATSPPTEHPEEEDPHLSLDSSMSRMGACGGGGGGGGGGRLPGIAPIDRNRLLHKALVAVARNWSFHVEYDQHYLHALSAGLKSQLLSYVALYSDSGVGIAGLRVLFKNSDKGEDDDCTTLDLSRGIGIGAGLSMSQLEAFLRPPPPPPPCRSPAKADAWDSVPDNLGGRRLPALTHLSLAYPLEHVPWSMLLSVAKIVPTITHLSLAGWAAPYQGAVKQLAKTLICLKWLDVSDCPVALYDGLMQVEWWGVWRGVETIVATQESGAESTEVRDLRRARVMLLAGHIKGMRQERGGKWCKVLV